MFIAAGSQGVFNRFALSWKPIVFIGLISYPLYLWHWVILSYLKIITGSDLGDLAWLKVAAILASITLSILTYYLIERPIRFGKRSRGIKAIALMVVLIGVGVGGTILYKSGGIEDRWIAQEMSAYEKGAEKQRDRFIDAECLQKFVGFENRKTLICRYMDANSSKTVALIGDSHAHAAFDAIATYNKQRGINTILLAQHSTGNPIVGDKNNKQYFIDGLKEAVIDYLRNDHGIYKVFIIMRAEYYTLDNVQNAVNNYNLNNRKIYVVEDNPILARHIKDYLAVHPFNIINPIAQPPTKEYVLNSRKIFLDAISKLNGAIVIRTIDAFCPANRCLLTDDNKLPLYFDSDHLTTIAGGRFLVEKVLKSYLNE
jgi:hypothetical protein